MTLTFAVAPLLLFIGPAKRHRDLPAHPAAGITITDGRTDARLRG